MRDPAIWMREGKGQSIAGAVEMMEGTVFDLGAGDDGVEAAVAAEPSTSRVPEDA